MRPLAAPGQDVGEAAQDALGRETAELPVEVAEPVRRHGRHCPVVEEKHLRTNTGRHWSRRTTKVSFEIRLTTTESKLFHFLTRALFHSPRYWATQ